MTWHCITYVWILICLHSYYIASMYVRYDLGFSLLRLVALWTQILQLTWKAEWLWRNPMEIPNMMNHLYVYIKREREREKKKEFFWGEGGALKHHLYAYTCWFTCLFRSHLVFQLGNYCGIGFLQKDANKCLWFYSIHHKSDEFKHKLRCFWKHIQCLLITQWSIIVSSFPHTCCLIVSVGDAHLSSLMSCF